MQIYFVYMLRCSDGSIYVGQTQDVANRLKQHNAGEGAKHTRDRRPVVLLYSEEFQTVAEAVRRERQLKRWSHAKKEALIRGDAEALKRLSKRRQ